MKKVEIMRRLIIIVLASISFNVQAQFTSYLETRHETQAFFDLAFSSYDKKDGPVVFTIFAKDNFELKYQYGPCNDNKASIEYILTSVNCKNCQEKSVFYSNQPIKKIFDLMEYQDIFRITMNEEKNNYKVVHYQPKKK